jgi:hypothetical protein
MACCRASNWGETEDEDEAEAEACAWANALDLAQVVTPSGAGVEPPDVIGLGLLLLRCWFPLRNAVEKDCSDCQVMYSGFARQAEWKFQVWTGQGLLLLQPVHRIVSANALSRRAEYLV